MAKRTATPIPAQQQDENWLLKTYCVDLAELRLKLAELTKAGVSEINLFEMHVLLREMAHKKDDVC